MFRTLKNNLFFIGVRKFADTNYSETTDVQKLSDKKGFRPI